MADGAVGGNGTFASKPAETSDKSVAALAPFELRNKRSALTRCTTKIVRFVAEAQDSVESLYQARRLAEHIEKSWKELLAAMAIQVQAFTTAADEEKLAAEYDKHVPYEVQMEDYRELIQQQIDRLSGMFGERSQGSSVYHSNDQAELPAAGENIEQPLLENSQHPSEPTPGSPIDASSGLQPNPGNTSNPRSSLVKIKDPESKLTKFNGDPSRFRKWWSIFSVYVDTQPSRLPRSSVYSRQHSLGKQLERSHISISTVNRTS